MKDYPDYEVKTPWYGNEPIEPKAKNPNDRKPLSREELAEFNRKYEEYIVSHEEWEKSRSFYKEEERRLFQEFTSDVLDYVGLSNHPKKKEIFDYVYSNHKGESKEVIHSVLSELCELSYKEV